MRLSNSSLDKYRLCPRMYDLHYNHRIRPVTLSSPLFFGSAVDQALNVLLLKKKRILNEEESSLVKRNMFDVFDDTFSEIKFNGEIVKLKVYDKAKYAKTDFDERLLTGEDWSKIIKFADNYDKVEILNFFKTSKSVHKEDIELINYMNWLSLRRKGHLFLSTYEKEVLPRIIEVHSIQRQTNLTNSQGDAYIGVIDFIATWDDGNKYIFDNKTASRKYLDNSVKTSTQLMTYSEDTGINLAGYIIMLKSLTWDKHNKCTKCDYASISRHVQCPKKCGALEFTYEPKVSIQIILDSVVEENKDKMFLEIQDIADSIKEENFEPDWNKCANVFGQKCPYYDYCRNESLDGLVIVQDEKK